MGPVTASAVEQLYPRYAVLYRCPFLSILLQIAREALHVLHECGQVTCLPARRQDRTAIHAIVVHAVAVVKAVLRHLVLRKCIGVSDGGWWMRMVLVDARARCLRKVWRDAV